MNTAPHLSPAFFRRDPQVLAKSLLGQRVVRMYNGQRLAGLIVETEAYLGLEDKAAHTYKGKRTLRNQSMWLAGGTLYVYFTYGMYYCMNVVASKTDHPVAVLIRALQPTEGLEQMRLNRQSHYKLKSTRVLRDTDLCSGPGKLCQALVISREQDGVDLTGNDEIFIERVRSRPLSAQKIAVGPRIGIAYAEDWIDKPLRFWVKDSPFVSR